MNVLKVEYVYNDGSVVYAVYDATPIVCFVAGTKVLTETGLINIEDITAGMKVYSRNMETNQNELKEVLATSKRKVEMCTYEISVNGEKIESTGNHPFYVKGKGYVEASKLINGDILIDSNNNDHEISDIKIINNAETVTVYNLNVDDNHNYYVGQSKVLVHNAACRT